MTDEPIRFGDVVAFKGYRGPLLVVDINADGSTVTVAWCIGPGYRPHEDIVATNRLHIIRRMQSFDR